MAASRLVRNPHVDRDHVPLYEQAGNKPYAIAAMVFLSKVADPVARLHDLWETATPRWQQ